MIELKANSTKSENATGVDVTIKIHADDKKTATKELFIILKELDNKFPDILMDAIELHIKDIIRNEFMKGGDDD